MDRVVLAPEADGLGEMLAELIRANLIAHPERARLIDGARGTVNIGVTDADVTVALRFAGGSVHIGPRDGAADLSIACDSATLMSLTAVPLRFGLPDALTADGRAVVKKMLSGTLKVRGISRHLGLMTKMQRLFSVA